MTSLTALMAVAAVLGLVVMRSQIQAFLLHEMVSLMAKALYFGKKAK